MKTSQGSWIAYRKTKPAAALRLFCFPYAGAGATVFRAWNKDLPESIELCPLQLPGRETRVMEPAFSRIEPLIASLADAMKPLLDLPYLFFGYSMGAIIAFELTRALREKFGSTPAHLFLAARRGPRVPDPYPRTENLDNREFVDTLRRLGGTPRQILDNPQVLEIILPMLRGDFALCENYTYVPGTLMDCPITVFGGEDDPKTTRETLAAWSSETSSSCRVKMVAGDHFFIHSSQAELLKTILETAPARDFLPAALSPSAT